MSNTTDVASLLGLGDIYFAAAMYDEAISWYTTILDLDPKNQVANARRLMALQRM